MEKHSICKCAFPVWGQEGSLKRLLNKGIYFFDPNLFQAHLSPYSLQSCSSVAACNELPLPLGWRWGRRQGWMRAAALHGPGHPAGHRCSLLFPTWHSVCTFPSDPLCVHMTSLKNVKSTSYFPGWQQTQRIVHCIYWLLKNRKCSFLSAAF